MRLLSCSALACILALPFTAHADENLFGYVKGAETLPKGSMELYEIVTRRSDKGAGEYDAWDMETELEYGVTDRFNISGSIKLMSIDTSGLIIDGYLPGAEQYGPKFAGGEFAMKYNFLSPAKDDFGLSGYMSFDYGTLDPHSGKDKTTRSVDLQLLAQKYFMEGQMIWVGNIAMENTYAVRDPLAVQPTSNFDWPLEPEMEIEWKFGTGLSYRFMPNWYLGAEAIYETEFETEVGQERWSLFLGPSLHYGGPSFWATLTWFDQLRGGGEKYENQYPDENNPVPQADTGLHLVEKTKDEWRLKVGFNF